MASRLRRAWPCLAVALALHALVLAVWMRPGRHESPLLVADEQPPLRVTLLAAAPGAGNDPFAPPPPQPVAEGGEQVRLPQPPPAPASPATVPVAATPDRPALAVTSPDLSTLASLPTPVAPIRLRLRIEADGQVGDVDALEYNPADEPFVLRLIELLRATPHIPARKDGHDVASVKEIRLVFGPG